MSWTCPTCDRRLELWEQECPHCAVADSPSSESTPSPEAASSEPTADSPETTQVDTGPEMKEVVPSAEAEPTPPPPGSVQTINTGIPWVVYLVPALVLTVLVFLLWPSHRVNLQVQTEPDGATVLLDRKLAGLTPLELAGLKQGRRYTLRVELGGYAPFEQTFVAEAHENPWTIPLERSFDPLLDEKVVQELVGQIGESAQETLFSHELAGALFTVNPLIEQNPWLTESSWSQIFQQVVQTSFGGDSEEFLHHLEAYKTELAQGKTSKQAWYQHVHECEKVCRPLVTEVFKRHIEWLRRSGFTIVYFPMNQRRLTDKDAAAIRQFVAQHNLAEDTSRQVLLVGRASRIGGQQYNLELSRRRVESVTRELAAQLTDGRERLRRVHLGFEPPQISRSVAEFLRLDLALSEAQRNQSVMLIVSEPLPSRRPA